MPLGVPFLGISVKLSQAMPLWRSHSSVAAGVSSAAAIVVIWFLTCRRQEM